MKKTPIRLAAAGVTLALAAVACGGNDGNDVAPAASQTTMPGHGSSTPSTSAAGADTAAADLRGALTNLLADHVWLAGNALETAVLKGGNLKDPEVQGAVKALDDNSVALSKAVGSVYPEAEKPFLDSWRQHIGFFVDYTLGKATKDSVKVEKAKKDLDGYRTSFGQLINSVVPELPAAAVAEELKPHVASLFAAIDSMIADPNVTQSKLTEATSHMPMTAEILATGIAKNKGL
jgi:hypothetical protein